MPNAPTRRTLATVATVLAAFGSAGPFAGSAEAANQSEELASFEFYASQEYEAWPQDTGGDLIDKAKFRERCCADFMLIQMALAVMKRDHLQNAVVAASASSTAADMTLFAESLSDAAERYRGLSEMLDSAHVRVLAAVARHLQSIGEVG